jgi:antitoxin PrlF
MFYFTRFHIEYKTLLLQRIKRNCKDFLEGMIKIQLAKVSSKGQITIPKLIRDVLEINQGDNIAFCFHDNSITICKADITNLMRKEN